MKEGSDKSVSAWEKAKILSVIVASVFIPLAVALSGNWYAKSLKEKDTQARYIELAIGILMKEPTPENEQIRKWAIRYDQSLLGSADPGTRQAGVA